MSSVYGIFNTRLDNSNSLIHCFKEENCFRSICSENLKIRNKDFSSVHCSTLEWVTRKHWPPVCGPSLRTGSTDCLLTGPPTTPPDLPTDHPQNRIKISLTASPIDHYCRRNFERYAEKNVTDLGSVLGASFIIRDHYKLAIFSAVVFAWKIGKPQVLTFCLWLNRAGKDAILGRSNLYVFEFPLSKLWSLGRVDEPAGEWAEQNGGWNAVKAAQISRLPRVLPVFHAYL